MKFKIPFSFASLDKLKKRSEYFKKFVAQKKNSKLRDMLSGSDIPLTREEYLSICISGFVTSFIVLFILSSTVLYFFGISYALLYAAVISFLFGAFVFFSRSVYPKVYTNRKIKEIERNLIPALEDVLVQLNSGIPLFSILVNISASDYGALSEEFKKVVKKINAGLSDADVLEEVGEKNPSMFFRRALWQVSNGMKSGSDISIIISESIKSLTEEQLLQIQNYGNKLNPMIMFYMLVSVIMPALSITFLTVISSLVNLSAAITQLLFISLFVFVVLIQIVFLGVIKSLRPSLL